MRRRHQHLDAIIGDMDDDDAADNGMICAFVFWLTHVSVYVDMSRSSAIAEDRLLFNIIMYVRRWYDKVTYQPLMMKLGGEKVGEGKLVLSGRQLTLSAPHSHSPFSVAGEQIT